MKALFPGSFDPFTAGHDNVVRRILPLFDEVVIAVGRNEQKQVLQSADSRVEAIRLLYRDEPKVRVEAYEGLTALFAQTRGCAFIVRGLRSVKDFEYERDMAQVNKTLTGVETLFLPTDPAFSALSSSMVRELIGYGVDPTPFLPKKNKNEKPTETHA